MKNIQEVDLQEELPLDSPFAIDLSKHKLLSEAKKEELVRQLKKYPDSAELRERFLAQYYRLVISIAKQYISRANFLKFEDLLQEGVLGLFHGLDKFEPDKDFRFTTYGTWWIRQYIGRLVKDKDRLVRVPVYMVDQIHRLYKIEERLSQELGRGPTPAEIAYEAGLSAKAVQQIEEAMAIGRVPLSLDAPLSHDGPEKDTLGDVALRVEVNFFVGEEGRSEEVEILLACLSGRQREIILLRYFSLTEDGKRPTLNEVAAMLNTSRQNVDQAEKNALKKMRFQAERNSLFLRSRT